MPLLKLIRYKNLIMIAIVQLLIKYTFLQPLGAAISLSTIGFMSLILATIFIAAAGNIINDIFDVETDLINKPKKVIVGKLISEKTAFTLFIVFNIIGVGLGYYTSFLVDKPAFFSLFVVISVLLYVYASYLKQTILIGNIVVSLLVALSLVIVGVFDLLPAINKYNMSLQLVYFKTILNYAFFAFLINLTREIAKDIEDINGDFKAGMNTLPIAIGRTRAKNLLFALIIIPIVAVTYYLVYKIYKHQYLVIYFLLTVLGPLIYTAIKIFNAKTKTHYSHVSNMLKIVMFFGVLSLLLYNYA